MRYFIKKRSSFRIKQLAPFIIFFLAIILVGLIFFGDDSYIRLKAIRAELEQRRSENTTAKKQVDELKKEVANLKKDPRTLEKAARNELGMLRPNEVIFIYKENGSQNGKK